ncbi:MAG: hypothetical protein NTU47_18840 [Ignavibacteriales bacterium]|nr:hypothetical protein [Ignavibacteriales bacterium]
MVSLPPSSISGISDQMSHRTFFGTGIVFLIGGGLAIVLTQFSCAPDFEKLTVVQGTITRVQFAGPRRKVSAKLILHLETNQGELEIHAEDPTDKRPEVRSVHTGDFVQAWIVKDDLWRGFYWAWQLKHYDRIMFSYRDMLDIEDEQKERARNILGYGGCAIGLVLLLISFIKKEPPWTRILTGRAAS